MQLSRVLKNKVVLYMGTRYITYALQFIASLVIAFKLGPDEFGVWSFLLMIINFFNIFDLGISNSLNVLMVQSRDDRERVNTHIKSAIAITAFLSLLVVCIYGIIQFVQPGIILKYDASPYLLSLLAIVVLVYFNKIFATIYRVNNKLLEISVFQSIVPFFLFFCAIFLKTNVAFLVFSYLVGNLIAFLVFMVNGEISFQGKFDVKDLSVVSGKGFWLFLYNSAFYYILYSSSFLVSVFFPRPEYGKYNFAYTISHAVILLIDAFGYIIFPKMILKLKESDRNVNNQAIDRIRSNYMALVYLLIFVAVPLICIAIRFIPKYADTGRVISLAALTLLPYANCFGINTFLIAQNREKTLSLVSLGCFLFNIAAAFISIKVLHVSYEYVYVPILLSYIIYTFSCSYLASKILGKRTDFKSVLIYAFPKGTWGPFFLYVFLIVSECKILPLFFVPLVLYVSLNMRGLRQMFGTIKAIVVKPEIVDI